MGLNRRNPKAITDLTEDMEAIGLVPGGAALATRDGGGLLSEDTDDDRDELDEDPIDGSMVTDELLDRIMGLDFDSLGEEDFDDLLNGLSKKNLPEGDSRIKARTEEVVEALVEGRIVKILKRGGKGLKRIVKKTGGAAIKAARERKKKMRTAAGKRQLRKKARRAKKAVARILRFRSAKKRKRLGKAGMTSDVAADLDAALSEGVGGETVTERDEILHSIADIFDLLEADFADAEVGRVFDEALEPLVSAENGGLIAEDAMDEDEFMALVKPALTVIARSLERLEEQDQDDLGNLQSLSV